MWRPTRPRWLSITPTLSDSSETGRWPSTPNRNAFDYNSSICSSTPTCLSERQELQDCELTFPIVADASGEVFSLLGLVREDAIDPAKGIVPQVRMYSLYSFIAEFLAVMVDVVGVPDLTSVFVEPQQRTRFFVNVCSIS